MNTKICNFAPIHVLTTTNNTQNQREIFFDGYSENAGKLMTIEASKKYEVILPPWMNQMEVAHSSLDESSSKFRAKHTHWGEVNGEIVFVLSLKRNPYGWGEDQAKVYLVQDNYTEWFKVNVTLLQDLAVSAPDPVCNCDLTLLMNRGCQCGAAKN